MLDFITVVKTDIDSKILESNICNLKMSISLRRDGLSFYILESCGIKRLGYLEYKSSVDILSLENIDYVLIDLLDKYPLFREIDKILYVRNNFFTFVPEQFYEESKWRDIINFVLGEPENGYAISNDYVDGKYVLFAYPKNIIDSFMRVLGNLKISHASVLLMLRQCGSSNSKYDIIVFVCGCELELLIYKEKCFLFYNMFEYTSDSDIVYYIMSVMDKYEIDVDDVTLVLDVNDDSNLIDVLKAYFTNVIRDNY